MSRSFEPPYFGSDSLRRAAHWIDVRLNRFLRPGSLDWAAACHLAPLVALSIPGAGALVALLIWRAKRDVEPGVATQGREALNFQLNVAFWAVIALAFFLLPALLVHIVAAALAVIGGLATLRGEDFRYPFILRIVE